MPADLFLRKLEALRQLAHKHKHNRAITSRYWLLDQIGDPTRLPPAYRSLFVRTLDDGRYEYGPARLKHNDRYRLAKFCLVNGLDPRRMIEFMRSHGAFDEKPDREKEWRSTYSNMRISNQNDKQSAYSVRDKSYVCLDGEPDEMMNQKTGHSAYEYTFKVDPKTKKRTHYREHILVGRALGSYKQPPWKPIKRLSHR